MNRVRVLSGLAALGLAVGMAGGQGPADGSKPGGPPPNAGAKSPAKGSLEEAIAAALRGHPDVRVAEAEVQLAQAKLAQAKLAVAQKVTAAHLAVERARADVKVAEAAFARMEQLRKAAAVPNEEVESARQKMDTAKAEAAKAEAEYNGLLGTTPVAGLQAAFQLMTTPGDRVAVVTSDAVVRVIPGGQQGILAEVAFDAFAPPKAPAGSVPDKLKEALDKPVKLGDQKNVGIEAFLGTLTRVAGIDLRVRVPQREDPAVWQDALKLTVPGGEFPLGTWFQLVTDEYALRAMPPGGTPFGQAPQHAARYEIYVREYGLLVADPKTAPPGAITVQEFWKQVRAEKAKEKDAPKK